MRETAFSAARLPALLCAAVLLAGCAELALLNAAAMLSKQLTPDPTREVEVAQRTYPHPVGDVWAALLQVVERDERKIVEQDDVRHVTRVSYPFSWLHNRWGGELRFECRADAGDSQDTVTAVHVFGGATDAPFRVRGLAQDILGTLGARLAGPPASRPR